MTKTTRARVRRFEVQLDGPRVGSGEIDFDSLVEFGEHFQDAIRRLVNVLHGKPAVVPGHPTTAATEAASFRLVGIKKGSTILQLKATSSDLWPGAADMAVVELGRRVHDPKASMDTGIVAALEEARSSLGSAGRFRVKSHGMKTMLIDHRAVERLRARAVAQARTESASRVISGWLHMADLQPNEFIIRAPSGVEWRCTFSPSMKVGVLALLDHVVVAAGRGTQSGRMGQLDIDTITEAPSVYQQTLEGGSERLAPPDLPTTTRLRLQHRAGPEITRDDVDQLLRSIEARESPRS